MANKTNSKAVKDAIYQHICDHIDAEAYGCASVGDAVRGQLLYMQHGNEGYYQAARRFVEGGSFLIYNGDIAAEVQRWTESQKAYPFEKTYELYVRLMARELVALAALK